MKSFWLNLCGVLVASAITANAVLLWQINQRLTRVEARLESLAPASHASDLIVPDKFAMMDFYVSTNLVSP